MLEFELFDIDVWNCVIECLDCQIYIGLFYCELDLVIVRYLVQVDWNRCLSVKSYVDECEQFLMVNLFVVLEVVLGDVIVLVIVDWVRQVVD